MNRTRWPRGSAVRAAALTLLLCVGCGGSGGGGSSAVPGSSLSFDGIDDFVHVPAAYVLSTFTVEAWVKPMSLSATGTQQGIVGKDASFAVYLPTDTTGNWASKICRPACAGANTGAQKLVLGTWQHLACVYTGAELRLYRNGDLVYAPPITGDPTDPTSVDIGRLLFEGYFHGLIDEVRLWAGVRSQSEIRASMSRVLGGSEVGLLGYWRFEEGSGQVAGDSTPAGNDGTLGSAAGTDAADPAWVADGPPLS